MYSRILEQLIYASLQKSLDLIIIYGARQVGKTSLCLKILEKFNSDQENLVNKFNKSRYFNCEEKLVQQAFAENDLSKILELIGDYDLVILDEAQTIKDIGWRLKLISDYNSTAIKSIKIIATGSSSFELANKINEPLTGRAEIFEMFPLCLKEIKADLSIHELKEKTNEMLVFGTYPSVFGKSLETKNKEMQKVFDNYLYKDILTWETLKKSTLLKDLLKLLALMIGKEISLNSLAQKLNVSIATISRYLDLLQQTFIIFPLRTLNTNGTKEISRSFKIYFYDLGVRNYLINNFNPIPLRTDFGEIWENFIVAEMFKQNSYNKHLSFGFNQYFWKSYTKAEIDFVQEKNGEYNALEIKYNSKKSPKVPVEFTRLYPNHTFEVINCDNFPSFFV